MDTQTPPQDRPPLLRQDAALRAHLVRIILDSSDGSLSAGELDTVQGSLRAVGYSSLSFIRLIDGIENELGVYIDPDADIALFDTVDSILGLVVESRDGAGA
jgi:acyl carrier protein